MDKPKKKKYKKYFLPVLPLLLVLFAGFLLYRESIPFYPLKELRARPTDCGLAYQNIRIQTRNNERLAGWYIPATAANNGPGAGKTLLYFHGNGGNLSFYLKPLSTLHGLGFAVCAIDYQGFGESSGRPSVAATRTDAVAVWDWLVREKDCKPQDLVLYGHSLGGGVATSLAVKVRPAALILESTFTSLHDVGKEQFPYLPLGLFLPHDYDTPGNLRHLQQSRVPLLVLHSRDDEVISFHQGWSLYQNYQGPKQFVELKGTHNSAFHASEDVYLSGLEFFLASLPEQKNL